MHPHAPPGQQSAQQLGQVERGRLGDRVGRSEREGGEGHRRHVVDDGALGTSQQRQEGLGDAVGAEEVDGEMLFERGPLAEVVVERDARVVDEDVERLDAVGRGRICAALVTSRLSGVTRASGWSRGWRVQAYTRSAPRRRASVTSACPMPRFAPVTSTLLPSIFISVAPVCGFRATSEAAHYTDQPDSRDSPRPAPICGSLACPWPRVLLRPDRGGCPPCGQELACWTLVTEEPGQAAGRERDGHARRWHGAARPGAPAREVVAGPRRAGGPGRRAGDGGHGHRPGDRGRVPGLRGPVRL